MEEKKYWVLIAVLASSRVVAMIVLPVYDDAFITFHSAQNFAAGQGLVFNAGESVMGLTCPAFGLFQGVFASIGLPLHVTIPIINIALDLAIALSIARLLRRSESDQRSIPLVLGMFILSPSLARTTVGGMEMNLFLLLSLISIDLFLRRREKLSILLASLTYFVRPEAVLLVGVLLIAEFLWFSRKNAWILAVISLCTVAPGLVILQLKYGNFLPQSVTAKATHSQANALSTIYQLFLNGGFHLALLPFALLGLIKYMKQQNRLLFILGAWFIAYVLAYAAFRPFVWSWYGFAPRFIEIVFAGLGIIWILQQQFMARIALQLSSRRLTYAFATLGILVWAGVLIVAGPSKVTAHIYKPMQEFGRTVGPANTILADDIGAIGYFTGAKIYDTYGLVWPAAVGRNIHDLIIDTKPDYLVITASRYTKAMMDTSVFRDEYRFERMLQKDPRDTAAALRSLGTEWVQEYLIYRRI